MNTRCEHCGGTGDRYTSAGAAGESCSFCKGTGDAPLSPNSGRNPTKESLRGLVTAGEDPPQCCGSCEQHRGRVTLVWVYDPRNERDWGYLNYCEAAIEEDRRRGFCVSDEIVRF